MTLGGDQPWTRRVIMVSSCPQVGSMFNEGICNAQRRIRRVVLTPGPWRVMRPTTRPSSLGRHPCKPVAAVRSGF